MSEFGPQREANEESNDLMTDSESLRPFGIEPTQKGIAIAQAVPVEPTDSGLRRINIKGVDSEGNIVVSYPADYPDPNYQGQTMTMDADTFTHYWKQKEGLADTEEKA